MLHQVVGIGLNIWDAFNHLIAPKYCLICGELTYSDPNSFDFLCSTCRDAMPAPPDSRELINRLSGSLRADDIALDYAVSLFTVSNDRDYMTLIHHLKYYNYRKIAYIFGLEIGKYLKNLNKTDFDLIVPIPIHSAKKRERGYNQSDLIAAGVADYLNIPYDLKVCKRVSYTQTQTRLSKNLRIDNVKGIFKIKDTNIVKNKSILIVDDVYTTGSTINSLALELLESGANSVISATIASA
jgi:ComF family protein